MTRKPQSYVSAESFAGWANFIKGLTFGNYPFLKSAGYSLFITIVSTALILLCTSMAAWYIARVDSKFCRMVYYLCIFSMVVPFQMVMFTLSKTADTLTLAIKNDDAEAKTRGLMTLASGFVVFALTLSLNLFGITA